MKTYMEEFKKELSSTGMKNAEEDEKKLVYQMTAEEQELYNFYITRFRKAKEQREKNREMFDDLSYEQDYLMNQRALNSYLRRKLNQDEVRVNTPTTENKVQAVANEILNLNLQPEILAYDKDDTEITSLGAEFQDIIDRTNEMENDEDKYIDATFEMLAQRAVFVEELWIDKKYHSQHIQRCEKRILSGLQVYLGDICLPAWRFNEQPYIIKYEKMGYEEARAIWGDSDMWQYVTKGTGSGSNDVFGYRMNSLDKEEVEIIHYFSYPDDEYMAVVNGVMMFDKAQKLPWRWEGYNITMTILKPMATDFAYGKSLISSAKTLQALDNETIRNMIRKMRQAIEPPIGTKSGRIYSRDIWNAGNVAQGVKKDDFDVLIDHDGVTQSELQMLTLIENKVGEFIGAASPMSQTKRLTAVEVREAQKQAIKMLGLSVFAAMRIKRNMTFLRIYNVLENLTKPTGKKLNQFDKKIQSTYRRFTIVNTDIDESKKGKKIIQMTNAGMTEEQLAAVYRFEKAQEKRGNLTRVKFVDVKMLNSVKVNWFVTVINKERDSSELARAQYADKIKQGNEIATITQRPLNANKIIEGFEKVWNSKDLFQQQAPPAPAMQPGQAPGGQSQIGSQLLKAGGAQPAPQPSINQLSGGEGGASEPQ